MSQHLVGVSFAIVARHSYSGNDVLWPQEPNEFLQITEGGVLAVWDQMNLPGWLLVHGEALRLRLECPACGNEPHGTFVPIPALTKHKTPSPCRCFCTAQASYLIPRSDGIQILPHNPWPVMHVPRQRDVLGLEIRQQKSRHSRQCDSMIAQELTGQTGCPCSCSWV